MDFQIRITTGIKSDSLYDNLHDNHGLERFDEIMKDFDLPSYLTPKDISINDDCPSSRMSALIDIHNVETVVNHSKVSVNKGVILKNPLLNTPEHFKQKQETTITIPQGYLSKFSTEYIADIDYGTNTIIQDLIYFFSFNKLCRRSIKKVHISHVIDFGRFIDEWAESGFPKFFGFTQEAFEARKNHILDLASKVLEAAIENHKKANTK